MRGKWSSAAGEGGDQQSGGILTVEGLALP